MVFNARYNGQVRQMKVHRAVMLAFCGDCPTGHEVAHLDGNPSNNRLANLKFVTPKENNSHKIGHGTQPMGEAVYNAVLTESDVRQIRTAWPTKSYSKLAQEFNVHIMTIAGIVTRRTWKHI